MDLVAGAMGNLAPKLLQLLQDKYKLQKSVKDRVVYLAKELEAAHVALSKVAQVPHDQLDPQVKLWASQAREASYDMEDILDNFFVRADNCHQTTGDADKGNIRRRVKKMLEKFSLSKFKARHDIAVAIEDIKRQVDEMTKRRDRFKVDDALAKSATTSIDPRVLTLHKKASELIGIDEPRDELIKMLTIGDDDSCDKKTKIVSIVGSGGLGKTTLAKVVYEKLTVDMSICCKAFIPVGQKPDLKKVLRDILLALDKEHCRNIPTFTTMDERQLIEETRGFLKEKRYFIVIDDVWDSPSWNAIRTALDDNNLGSKIMITTRCGDVADLVHCTYKIHPLRPDSSKILFYGRVFGSEDQCPKSLSGLSEKILKKCDGVPLAIITIASLLANKSNNIAEWQEVCSSIGSGLRGTNDAHNDMRKILCLSYYDLPSDMKNCFLYLSMYPEDDEIVRDQLVWRWISEGFIRPQKKSDDLFELGRSYFNDLINRSLVQPIDWKMDAEIYSCRVHDMILDLSCSLSREENFVAITSDDIEQVISSKSKKLRRLSLRSTATWPQKGVSQVRSIALFGARMHTMPSFSRLEMLRVLDLEGCSLYDCGGSDKLYVGNLIHLRYLGLRHTCLKMLLGGIEKLQYLQVLRLDDDMELPESIFGLRGLMCLEGVCCVPPPGNLLSNLASLQVLDALYLGEDSTGIAEALGHLTRLTRLGIEFMSGMVDQSTGDTLIDSLCNLSRLKTLIIVGMYNASINWEHWVPPPQLLQLFDIFSWALPKWVRPALLPHLSCLEIHVHTVRAEDIQILGTLPNLWHIGLVADHKVYLEQPLQKVVITADAFPRVRHCYLANVIVVPSMFTRGAMPLLEKFRFPIRAWDFFCNHLSPSKGLDFDDLAMDHLPSLEDVSCGIDVEDGITGEEEATKLREALQQAAAAHPNHPTTKIYVHGRATGGNDVTLDETDPKKETTGSSC